MGSISKSRRKRIYNITGGRCYYCGCNIAIDKFHVDHFIPKCKGEKYKDNSVPACSDCNTIKSDKTIEEFRQEIGEQYEKNIHARIMCKYSGIDNRNTKGTKFYFEAKNIKPI